QTKQRQECSQSVDVLEAGVVGDRAQNRRAYATHAEGKAEEEARNQAEIAWKQFLGIHKDRRKRGGKDKTDWKGKNRRGWQAHVRKRQREGCDAQDRAPDHILSPNPITERAPYDGASGDSELEEK